MIKLFTLFLMLFVSHFSFSQWSTNAAVNNAICTQPLAQERNQIVSDGSGGAIISWVDRRDNTIYAQRINNNGINQWVTNGVRICDTTYNSNVTTKMVSDGNGGAIIIYQTFQNGDYIIAQHINSNGILKWGTSGVQIASADQTTETEVTGDENGGAIISWIDINNDVYTQRVTKSGVIQWGVNGTPVTNDAFSQDRVKLINDGNGGAIIAWRDYRSGTAAIYAQKVNAAGLMQWIANGIAVTPAIGGSLDLQLINNAGGAIICWHNPTGSVYAQKLNSGGFSQWNTNGVAVCLTPDSQLSPQLVPDGTGGTIITWEDFRTGGSQAPFDIYAQKINSSGATAWSSDGVAICQSTAYKYNPQLAADDNGGATIVWADSRNGGVSTYYDIYAQKINSIGTVLWIPNGVEISTATLSQELPLIINDGNNGMISTWQDGRTIANANDIYAQRINADGTLGNQPVCNKPTGLKAINITASSAKIKWNTILDAAKYKLQYRVPGTTTWTSKKLSDTSYKLTGLMSAATYEYRVQTLCTADGSFKSNFTAVKTFTTAVALLSSSILEKAQNNIVTIYPNPANDFIIINYPSQKAIVTVTIYDAIGKLINQETRKNELQIKLDVKLLEPSIYFVQVSDNHTVTNLKFIKQ